MRAIGDQLPAAGDVDLGWCQCRLPGEIWGRGQYLTVCADYLLRGVGIASDQHWIGRGYDRAQVSQSV
ncbi:hypothetical protein [Mycobacterium simiae]|uniref:hypothetical protein n=1 Tax=Mycobacterium simiae TaxID=1784 RepID=UPI001E58B674|nr:hypothetical protein [Mycobacterium simiae]